ncbi:MAG TPA: hypothetical protein VG323_21385 [Thermoanaerobaculia bacterium]|nr:hypothetical protein [Thermoanaerobaculia bacterium]
MLLALYLVISTLAAGDRVAVVRTDGQGAIANEVRSNLARELRGVGIDAVDGADAGARYLLEVVSADAESTTDSATAWAGGLSGVRLTSIHAVVNVELRLYDARSHELVRAFEIHQSGPDGPVLGGGVVAGIPTEFGSFLLRPVVRRSQTHAAARAAAHEAALKLAPPR